MSELLKTLNLLEKNNQLISIEKEVDPHLEMAEIQLNAFKNKLPAVWFKNIKNTKFTAVSNLFGSHERVELMFKKTLPKIKKIFELVSEPQKIIKKPFSNITLLPFLINALPKWTKFDINKYYYPINISDLPQIKSWKMDGGAFITLPQVYTEDPYNPGIMKSNIGMYRIQISGNEYIKDQEVGLHYQIHRGIGVHQTGYKKLNKNMKVSVFVGGHPGNTLASVMPLPEGISETMFAGLLSGKRFEYTYWDGFCIPKEVDFIICGEVIPDQLKPEGPFGDHLGYYSLAHPFPVLKIKKVWARKNMAIYPFTVVGRPPQEDTFFGEIIHEITGDIITKKIPGLKAINAVDAAGVHPLLLAIGNERYTPFLEKKHPQELLTIANHILGYGQLSLAKFLIIMDNPEDNINIQNIPQFLEYFIERVDWQNDVHFITKTTIDTLDYSGSSLNFGSKVIMAATGKVKRNLQVNITNEIRMIFEKNNPKFCLKGVLGIEFDKFENYESEKEKVNNFLNSKKDKIKELAGIGLIVICDNTDFLSESINNFLWNTFTKSNPSHDLYGINEKTEFKHWGCDILVIDARKKPHHAPELIFND